MAGSYKQGVYTPRNPDKYVGDPTKIVFRSSWELSMNQFLDNNPNILRWGSEEIAIPYVKPTTGRVHKYYPDYWIEFRDQEGNIKQEIIEVKPDSQVNVSKKKRLTEYDKLTYVINLAKWQAATDFCNKHGIKFRILTENQMFRK
jgi:hypothetical protein